jgi:hypothetical protein
MIRSAAARCHVGLAVLDVAPRRGAPVPNGDKHVSPGSMPGARYE